MKYSVDDFAAAIDRRYDPRQSVVLRYRNALRFDDLGVDAARFRTLQERTSIAEGMRIFSLGTYRGVQIDVLDETTLMHTRTLKSIDGCVSTAHCLLHDYRSIVFESGGNTGVALTRYATRAGLATHCFVPAPNLGLLDGPFFEGSEAHLIAVEDPGQVKETARVFAARHGWPLIPKVAWRFHASMFVGCFLAEHLSDRASYDYLVQTISAAFGPIGIYRVLGEHVERLGRLPRFLGVQQESNNAMVRAWRAASGQSAGDSPATAADPLLAKVMYDREPQTHGTVEEFHRLLRTTGGDLVTINHAEFDHALRCSLGGPDLLGGLAANDVAVAMSHGEVLEKTGLLGVAGTVKQIESGYIQPGARVLVCLTGGTAQPRAAAAPESYIGSVGAQQNTSGATQ